MLSSMWEMPCSSRSVLELFAGIGGLACAWPEARIVAAIDINETAASVYRRNFSHPYWTREIASLSNNELRGCNADFWWMSPPCQPFSRRGRGRDIADPRTAGLLRVIDAIGECLPAAIGLENVIGFSESLACERLVDQLSKTGYQWLTAELCPSQLGWPNRRPRFYMLASRQTLPDWQPLPKFSIQLAQLIDTGITEANDFVEQLKLSSIECRRNLDGLDRIEAADELRPTACFASSYGKTLRHSGSYLRCGSTYRRFSPREVARLLGIQDTFLLDGLSPRTAWKLLGNSLSLPVVRYVLSHVPRLATQDC